MSLIFLRIALTVFLTLLGGRVFAQQSQSGFAQWQVPGVNSPYCPNGQCPMVPQQQQLQWRPIDGVPNQMALFNGNVQVGAVDVNTRVFRQLTNGQWGAPMNVPTEFAEDQAKDAPTKNFGIALDRIDAGGGKRYWMGKNEITHEQACQALAGADLVDDSSLPRLVCVGSEADCKRCLSDPSILPLLSKVQVVGRGDRLGYAPDDYWATKRGLTGGSPGIYLIKPDGTKLHAQVTWDGNAKPLLIAAGLEKPSPAVVPTPAARSGILGIWLVLGGIIAYVLYQKYAVQGKVGVA